MFASVNQKFRAPVGRHADAVAAAERKHFDEEREYVNQNQAKQVVGNGRQREQRRTKHAHHARHPGPGHDGAKHGADREGDQGCHTDEHNRPRQGDQDHVADAGREIANRKAEIPLGQVTEVIEVLLPDRLVEPEAGGECFGQLLHT